MVPKTYHHGDLRAALLAAALDAVEASNGDEVSLREVARAVGVSATAVYRHFPDKKALLRALGEVGIERLGQAQHAASAAAGGGTAGFNATGAAYVRFALANPGLFRLVFAHPMPADLDHAGRPLADDPMAMLQANAAALAPPGTDPRIFALQSWSLAHGLAMLLLDGQLTLEDAAIDAVIDAHALVGEAKRA